MRSPRWTSSSRNCCGTPWPRSNRPLRRAAIALADPSELKMAFLKGGTIAAEGRELAEILAGLTKSASDPELGAALYQLAKDNTDTIFGDLTLRGAWNMAARRQAEGVLAAAKPGGSKPAPPIEQKNLLPNPDFSEVSGEVPAGWTDFRYYQVVDREAVKVSVSPDGRSGNCLQISSDKPADFGVAVTVGLEAGARYRLSGWLRTENLKPVRGPGAMMNLHGGRRDRWSRREFRLEAGRSRVQCEGRRVLDPLPFRRIRRCHRHGLVGRCFPGQDRTGQFRDHALGSLGLPRDLCPA